MINAPQVSGEKGRSGDRIIYGKMYGLKVYGITGGAGTGKSELMKMLRDDFSGCVIISDDIARALTQKGAVSYKLIVEHFGAGILGADQEIDRAHLAEAVFNNEEELNRLNGMIHPQVRKEIESIIREAADSGKYAFVAIESAIILDCGYEDICDEFWYVYTRPEIRRQRMKETRGYSDERVDAVMKSQRPDEYFISRCQFVVENNSTLDDLYRQLKEKLG